MLLFRQARDTRKDARGERPCQQCDVMERALDDFDQAPHLVKASRTARGE